MSDLIQRLDNYDPHNGPEWFADELVELAAERIEKLETALRDIEQKGHHGGYHGMGYSLATIAQEALE